MATYDFIRENQVDYYKPYKMFVFFCLLHDFVDIFRLFLYQIVKKSKFLFIFVKILESPHSIGY